MDLAFEVIGDIFGGLGVKFSQRNDLERDYPVLTVVPAGPNRSLSALTNWLEQGKTPDLATALQAFQLKLPGTFRF